MQGRRRAASAQRDFARARTGAKRWPAGISSLRASKAVEGTRGRAGVFMSRSSHALGPQSSMVRALHRCVLLSDASSGRPPQPHPSACTPHTVLWLLGEAMNMVSQVRDLGPRTSLLKTPRPHELQQPPGQPQGRGTGEGWRTAACWGAPQNTAAPCTWRPPPRRPATSPRTGGAGQSEARLTQSGEGQTSTSLPPPAPLAPQTGRVRRGWAIRPARVLRGKKHQRRGRRTCSAARPAQTGPQARAPHSRGPEGTSRCRGCPRCARALPPHERPGHTAALGKGPSPGRRRLGDSSLAKGTPTGRALPCPEDSGLWPCRPTLRLISTSPGSTGAC